MTNALSPLVSIVTPVHSNAEYLASCIESVLAQTYSNWQYTILDFSSADQSHAIAETYAGSDSRIRVVKINQLLGVVERRNFALRQISTEAKYCKFVFAEDWLYPTCIEEMVQLAERKPSVGLVGAYTMDGQNVLWSGPPYPSECVPGLEICRSMLLDGPFNLGAMTSLLLRCDLVRGREDLFDQSNPHSEIGACFEVLQCSDYGYIHQVLSYHRQTESQRATPKDFDACILGQVCVFLKYGPALLTEAEFRTQWEKLRWKYHRVLAMSVYRMRSREYWRFHENTLKAFGQHIDKGLLVRSVAIELPRRVLALVRGALKALCSPVGMLGRDNV